MIKNASELLAAGALRTEVVKVCGVEVTIRELSIRQRKALSKIDQDRLAAHLVQACAIAPDGERLFTEEQVAELEELRAELVSGIAGAVLRMSIPEAIEGKD